MSRVNCCNQAITLIDPPCLPLGIGDRHNKFRRTSVLELGVRLALLSRAWSLARTWMVDPTLSTLVVAKVGERGPNSI